MEKWRRGSAVDMVVLELAKAVQGGSREGGQKGEKSAFCWVTLARVRLHRDGCEILKGNVLPEPL